MPNDMTDVEEVAVINARLRTDPRWLSLHTTAATDSTSGVECTDSGYARVSITFSAPVSGAGTTANNSDIDFGTAQAQYTVRGVGIWDALSSGNLRYHHTLSEPVTVAVGQYFSYATGALIVRFD